MLAVALGKTPKGIFLPQHGVNVMKLSNLRCSGLNSAVLKVKYAYFQRCGREILTVREQSSRKLTLKIFDKKDVNVKRRRGNQQLQQKISEKNTKPAKNG